jgi:hypothetical protein
MMRFSRWVRSLFGTKEQPISDAEVPLNNFTIPVNSIEVPPLARDVSTLRAEGKAKMSAKDYAAADQLFIAALAIEPENQDLKQLLITSRARATKAVKGI